MMLVSSYTLSLNLCLKMKSVQSNLRLCLNTTDYIHIVEVGDILYCRCNNSSTTFYLINRDPIVVSKSILEFEKLLPKPQFFRSHQSYLVNMEYVERIHKKNGLLLVLFDGTQIPASMRKKKELMQILP